MLEFNRTFRVDTPAGITIVFLRTGNPEDGNLVLTWTTITGSGETERREKPFSNTGDLFHFCEEIVSQHLVARIHYPIRFKTYTRVWDTIAEIKSANYAAGHYFFSTGAMRFFDSKIESSVLAYRHFITSEQGPDNVRRFSVRVVSDDGRVDTLSEHGQFESYPSALDWVIILQDVLDRMEDI